jgi:hypothetical protein
VFQRDLAGDLKEGAYTTARERRRMLCVETGNQGRREGCDKKVRENGAPSTTRTCDLLVRSQTLYPTELWARNKPTLESNIEDT